MRTLTRLLFEKSNKRNLGDNWRIWMCTGFNTTGLNYCYFVSHDKNIMVTERNSLLLGGMCWSIYSEMLLWLTLLPNGSPLPPLHPEMYVNIMTIYVAKHWQLWSRGWKYLDVHCFFHWTFSVGLKISKCKLWSKRKGIKP